MKVARSIVLLTLGVACCYGSLYTCMDGAVGAEAPDATCNTTAAGNTETCHMPIFTDYKGFANIEYGCGICVSGKDTTCAECTNTSPTTACNVEVATASFGCYSWSWSTDKWAKGAETTCKKKTASATECQQPGKYAKVDGDFTGLSGCGPCDSAENTAQKCSDCDKDKCNNGSGVVSISVILAALAALLHFM